MNCLRCAKQTAGRDVFCKECLEEMKRYPVKPGTVVTLPSRQETSLPRRKKDPTAEEQLEVAEKKMDNLHRWLLVMTSAAVLLGVLLYCSLTVDWTPEPEQTGNRNYTVVEFMD